MADLLSFISGILFGITLTLLALFYSMFGKQSPPSSPSSPTPPPTSKPDSTLVNPREKPLSPDERLQIESALDNLTGIIKLTQTDNEHPSEEKSPGEIKDLESVFSTLYQEGKERQKHIRAMSAFFIDITKTFALFSKEYSKISKIAEMFIIKSSSEGGNELKSFNKWWNALSLTFEQLSQDQDYLITIIQSDLLHYMSRLEQEHGHLEKQLSNEGTKLLSKLKEIFILKETKSKEYDRLKEKCGLPASMVDIDFVAFPKLIAPELALQEVSLKLAAMQQDCNEKMPRIIADYHLMASNVTSSMMELLIRMSDEFITSHQKSLQINQRLKMDLASSATTKGSDKTNYKPALRNMLELILEGRMPQMDMTLESSAGLAATLPSTLPKLPYQIHECIGSETCIWFNAFAGRIYRDAARSLKFHEFFCVKSAYMLNKGKRPSFIDEYVVSNPIFGSTPPLLRNMKWDPIVSEHGNLEYDVACVADMTFRSGMSFTVSTKLWLNWPRDRCAFIPVAIHLEIAECCGKIRFGVHKNYSYFSFVGEPFTRFVVHSEVGNQYKLRNLPQLSDMIINKIKKYIRTKVVHPNCMKLQLPWPKKWWPEPLPGEALVSGKYEPPPPVNETGDGLATTDAKVNGDSSDVKDSRKDENVSPEPPSSPRSSLMSWFIRNPATDKSTPSPNTTSGGTTTKELDISDHYMLQQDIIGDSKSYSIRKIDEQKLNSMLMHRDHVRSFVSELMSSASRMNNVLETNDDILVRDKSYLPESIAVKRTRAHSISDLRQTTLHAYWAEFLGSIGHDFSELADNDSRHGGTSMNNSRHGQSNSKHGFRKLISNVFFTSFYSNKRKQHGNKLKNSSSNNLLHTKSNGKKSDSDVVNAGNSDKPIKREVTLSTTTTNTISTPTNNTLTINTLPSTSSNTNTSTIINHKIIQSMEILQKESTATASTLVTTTTTSVGDLSLSNSGGKVKQVLFPEDDGAYTPRKTSPPIQNEVKTQSSSSNNSISVQNMSTAGKQISPLSAVENNLKKSVQVMKSAEEARQQQVLMNTKQQETLSRQTSPPSNQSQVATVIECTIKPLSPKNKSNSNLTQSSFMDTPKVKGISSTTSASNLSLPNEPSTPTSRSNKKVSQVFEAITSSSLVSKVGSAFKSNLFDGQKTSSSTHTTIKKPASAQLVQTYLPTNIDNYPESEKERAIFDCEQEALNMAWQAHAHAMALATERGEYPSIQSFLRTPRRNSPKVWAVLKDGYVKLFAQPAENVSKQVSLEGSEPLMVYHTAECVCVPLENAMSFEVSFLSLTGSGEYSNPIVFWAETDIQCRGWVMAIQHSSIIAPLSRCTPDT